MRIYLFLLGSLTVLEVNTSRTTVHKDNVLKSMPKFLLIIFLNYFKHISVEIKTPLYKKKHTFSFLHNMYLVSIIVKENINCIIAYKKQNKFRGEIFVKVLFIVYKKISSPTN